MSIFKKIPKDDIVISPYTAHKKYTLLLKNYSASFNGLAPANIYGYDGKHHHSFLKDAHVPKTKDAKIIIENIIPTIETINILFVFFLLT